jgi:hypothetical protein
MSHFYFAITAPVNSISDLTHYEQRTQGSLRCRHMAVQAARAAMEQAEVPPEEIDLIIRKVRPKTNVFRRSTAGWDDVQ